MCVCVGCFASCLLPTPDPRAPTEALQKHCSALTSNELWPLPSVGCRQMQVSELPALPWAQEGARHGCKALGLEKKEEEERRGPSKCGL